MVAGFFTRGLIKTVMDDCRHVVEDLSEQIRSTSIKVTAVTCCIYMQQIINFLKTTQLASRFVHEEDPMPSSALQRRPAEQQMRIRQQSHNKIRNKIRKGVAMTGAKYWDAHSKSSRYSNRGCAIYINGILIAQRKCKLQSGYDANAGAWRYEPAKNQGKMIHRLKHHKSTKRVCC